MDAAKKGGSKRVKDLGKTGKGAAKRARQASDGGDASDKVHAEIVQVKLEAGDQRHQLEGQGSQ